MINTFAKLAVVATITASPAIAVAGDWTEPGTHEIVRNGGSVFAVTSIELTGREANEHRSSIRMMTPPTGSTATVDQIGDGNSTRVRQRGKRQAARVKQSGNGTTVDVLQSGGENTLDVQVSRVNGQNFKVRQRGRGKTSVVYVNGLSQFGIDERK